MGTMKKTRLLPFNHPAVPSTATQNGIYKMKFAEGRHCVCVCAHVCACVCVRAHACVFFSELLGMSDLTEKNYIEKNSQIICC